MQIVAGESAANPAVPTVFPTKALSIFDNRGLARKIPNAGIANFSISRFEPIAFEFSSILASSPSSIFPFPLKRTLILGWTLFLLKHAVVLDGMANPYDGNKCVAAKIAKNLNLSMRMVISLMMTYNYTA